MKWHDEIGPIKDAIVLKQLINSLPADIHIFVKERKPKTTAEAEKLADDYHQLRKQESEPAQVQGRTAVRQHNQQAES